MAAAKSTLVEDEVKKATRRLLIETFAKGIAEYEGYHVTEEQARKKKMPFPTMAQRNKNPGNIRQWGSYPVVRNMVVFPSDKDGWRALHKQVERNVFDRQLTFLEFFAGQRKPDGSVKPKGYPGYAPASENNVKAYANFMRTFVVSKLNCPASTDIDSVIATIVINS